MVLMVFHAALALSLAARTCTISGGTEHKIAPSACRFGASSVSAASQSSVPRS
jgi:hypothetical protein